MFLIFFILLFHFQGPDHSGLYTVELVACELRPNHLYSGEDACPSSALPPRLTPFHLSIRLQPISSAVPPRYTLGASMGLSAGSSGATGVTVGTKGEDKSSVYNHDDVIRGEVSIGSGEGRSSLTRAVKIDKVSILAITSGTAELEELELLGNNSISTIIMGIAPSSILLPIDAVLHLLLHSSTRIDEVDIDFASGVDRAPTLRTVVVIRLGAAFHRRQKEEKKKRRKKRKGKSIRKQLVHKLYLVCFESISKRKPKALKATVMGSSSYVKQNKSKQKKTERRYQLKLRIQQFLVWGKV